MASQVQIPFEGRYPLQEHSAPISCADSEFCKRLHFVSSVLVRNAG